MIEAPAPGFGKMIDVVVVAVIGESSSPLLLLFSRESIDLSDRLNKTAGEREGCKLNGEWNR